MRLAALLVALLAAPSPVALVGVAEAAPSALTAPSPAAAAQAAPGTPQPAVAEAVVVVTVENMYSAPDDSKDVVSQATLGQTVALLEEKESFLRVRTPDRYEGWLPRAAVVAVRRRGERPATPEPASWSR